jgi:FkbH-like protein
LDRPNTEHKFTADEEFVQSLYRALLDRNPDPDGFQGYVGALKKGASRRELREIFLSSQEYAARNAQRTEPGSISIGARHMDAVGSYRIPGDLQRSPLAVRKVLMLGSCLLTPFADKVTQESSPVDFMLIQTLPNLPPTPPGPPNDYDFQIIQVPLRSIVPDMFFGQLPYSDSLGHEKLFDQARTRLISFLDAALEWNRTYAIPTFVWGFMPPQQNPTGRLLHRYDYRNMTYFIEELNKAMAHVCSQAKNCHYFDLDGCVSTFGRRYFQDDAVSLVNHGATLRLALHHFAQEPPSARLQGQFNSTEMFPERVEEVFSAIWQEHTAMLRTIRQVDSVKLVITDLDDTLWRGVMAEEAELSPGAAIEGWPIAYAEALHYLRRRGILLAVASKNDEARVLKLWDQLYSRKLSLSDFASIKINWRPKAENIAEILSELNLLPRNVVFIDDNPVERASVEAAFPGIRTFGPNPLIWRRTLLWAPECQVSDITQESSVRTEMVRAQVEREHLRQNSSRQDFLDSLNLHIELFEVDGATHPSYERALELLNKTNQYNTTGKRWTDQEFYACFANGRRVFCFKVRDKFTHYGVVGVIVARSTHIEQFVMSCRVVGMDVERAVLCKLIGEVFCQDGSDVTGDIVNTNANFVSRGIFESVGFKCDEGGVWRRSSADAVLYPSHASIELLLPKGELSHS